ncbi:MULTISPECIES: DeoR/GlpR family DNA-binding transcription regulator [Enterobacterales]|uniref:DeoR/GlpR family DNA-binding transcription regulator n=1 Tax=Enterobacterales TaxID=91347 RepID=UPI0007D8F3D7|nr:MULTISPECIES: DeoR/GlpR family DNA-binding transcription regulator [Enterobacterales]HBX4001165.1 DeoR/GlpR transcriptional regulator [Klebsiella variicola]MBZ6858833.1 DeoR/GlpR transcriptional regulator [Klebsiella michiganensis]MBZ7423218.1 DeoR/GlpR transcriptional regulator [Klebsiella michiganensis]MDU4137362.1 DeoR/GlpR family DNA-binding transcription regulator [Klebsiella michiganensis]MDU6718408.1 DeoR/GlpR family DNA-binding transcription regulator [Klebsiella michiganensis]
MNNQPRLDEIQRILSHEKRVRVSELADKFVVAEETIRRDLRYLEERGVLRRVHGGAILPVASEEQPLQIRSRIKPRAKIRIGELASGLIEEGMALFLDTGTSTLALAQQLKRFSGLKIITNSMDIAVLLTQQSENAVTLTPGRVRRIDNALIGPHTLEFARQFHYDIAFMGIGAVDRENGFMDYEEPEALLRRVLSTHCRQSVILADEGKFGLRTYVKTLPFSAVNTLVTNALPSADFVASLENEHVNILYPGNAADDITRPSVF